MNNLDKNCMNCRYGWMSNGKKPCLKCEHQNNWVTSIRIGSLIGKAHENAVDHGFWDIPREFGTMIALVHSELSEALEADRKGDKEHVAEELADVFIRLADLCGGLEIDIESAILAKMEKNKDRPRMHGKEY